jgi:hypothetical protein
MNGTGSVILSWLGLDATAILGLKFEPVELLRT